MIVVIFNRESLLSLVFLFKKIKVFTALLGLFSRFLRLLLLLLLAILLPKFAGADRTVFSLNGKDGVMELFLN